MSLEARDWIAAVSLILMCLSMLVVSRNARNATSVQRQSIDLTRIRDLRQELKETKDEVHNLKNQVAEMSARFLATEERLTIELMRREEMLRFARMPGMDMETWLNRFGDPRELRR